MPYMTCTIMNYGRFEHALEELMNLDDIILQAEQAIAAATDPAELDQVRVNFLRQKRFVH